MEFNLLGPKVPLVFTDGTEVYDTFKKLYITHKKGFFILGPSGVGKTHYAKNQTEKHWIDGDEIWQAANAHPDEAWWLKSDEYIKKIDAKCDVITNETMELGFWILGASNLWLKPSAIVLPEWETHKAWIKHREETNYDGGAKSDNLEGSLLHRKRIEEWTKHNVPKFETVDSAVEYLLSTL